MPGAQQGRQVAYLRGTKQRLFMASNNYWSSTENNATNAWNVNFSNGSYNNNNKTNNNYVRCVRRLISNIKDAVTNQFY